MTDDLEQHLRRDLPAAVLPPAPDSLHARLQAVVASEQGQATGRGIGRTFRLRALLGLAAALLIGGAAAISYVSSQRPPIPTAPIPTAPIPTTVIPTMPIPTTVIPATVDGLPLMSVSEAIAAHAEGRLPNGRAAIHGWWSNGSVAHHCAPPPESPAELELYCSDGEYGITELDEPMFVVDRNGLVTYQAQGPHLAPYLPEGIEGVGDLFALPIINGQRYPPVPILVVGHFDDPRAAQCRAEKRQLCRDRLVLERIVEFSPESVPTPGITAPPTAFPDPPPSPLFEPSQCAGDVPYSFTGWTTTAALELPYERPGHVYAAVTRDVVLLTEGGWQDDPNGSGHRFEIWGQRICIAQEGPGNAGTMEFSSVPSSTYVLWDDGLKVPGANPLRP